jgi:acyl-CoA thioester hydrolase
MFTTRITVRGYETDFLGHLNGSVYVQYADHALWECGRAAGAPAEELIADGVGPVNLATTIRYHRELRAGDVVDVSCRFVWGEGKTFRVEQEFRRPDGLLAAEVSSVCGLLDLNGRRLLPDPARVWRDIATFPELLDLERRRLVGASR